MAEQALRLWVKESLHDLVGFSSYFTKGHFVLQPTDTIYFYSFRE